MSDVKYLPDSWYNVMADLPELPAPALHPLTHEPLTGGTWRRVSDGVHRAGSEYGSLYCYSGRGAGDLCSLAAHSAAPGAQMEKRGYTCAHLL
jgi:hypothetical protein